MTEIVKYPNETLSDLDDDGTMPASRDALAASLIGHKIVAVKKGVGPAAYYGKAEGVAFLLDTGDLVWAAGESDCCAYTEIESIIPYLDKIEHVITGVGTTDEFNTWHIYADLGDVMELKVGWSCGNPFYYAYGLNVTVYSPEKQAELSNQLQLEG